MHRMLLHPCVSQDAGAIGCGEFFSATSILRFQSFFTQKRVVASYTFEVGARLLDWSLLHLQMTINSNTPTFAGVTGVTSMPKAIHGARSQGVFPPVGERRWLF